MWIHLFICIVVPSHFSFELPKTSSYLGNLLAQIDTPFAAFPSGHVGLPICLSLLLFKNAPKQSFLFGAWTILMCICTLATKQYSIVDVIGGLILGSLVGLTAISLDDDKKQHFRKKLATKTLLAAGCEWMLIILSLVLSLQFPSWPSYVISFCIIASRQHALFILYHDGVHGLWVKDLRTNDFLVNLSVGIPFLAPIQVYRPLHLSHHQQLGKADDPELRFLYAGQPWKYKPLSAVRFFQQVFYDLFGISFVMSLFALIRNPPTLKRFKGFDLWFLLACFIWFLILLGITCVEQAKTIFVLLYLPLYTLTQCLQKIRSFLEHGIKDEQNHTTYSWFPGFLGRLTIWPYHINFHREHHKFPSISWNQLPSLPSHTNLKNTNLALGHLLNLSRKKP